LNLFDICMEVLEHAHDLEMNISDEKCREIVATEIYDLFYEYQAYPQPYDMSHVGDIKEYWEYRRDFDEDE
jgi:hypothetical protein